MTTEVATSKVPEARISAGIQKSARNLAAEELLIEVITEKGKGLSAKQELKIPITDVYRIKIIFLLLLFG